MAKATEAIGLFTAKREEGKKSTTIDVVDWFPNVKAAWDGMRGVEGDYLPDSVAIIRCQPANLPELILSATFDGDGEVSFKSRGGFWNSARALRATMKAYSER